MDVSEFFKSSFIDVHKNTIGKNYQQRTLKDRVSNFNNMRRETRNTLIFQKRQIDKNMTPIKTPESSKIMKQRTAKKEIKKPNKRLDMLHKWKMEKEKRKQEANNKMKPLFKVCHIPMEVGLPNLENVNRNIKGKPIKLNTQTQSQFAPPNHKFCAPKNIKPINMNLVSNNNNNFQAKPKIDTFRNKGATPKVINKEHTRSHVNTRAATRKLEQEANKLNEKGKTKNSKTDITEKNPKPTNTHVQKVIASPKTRSQNIKSNRKDLNDARKRSPAKNKKQLDTKLAIASKSSVISDNKNKRAVTVKGNSTTNSSDIKKSRKSPKNNKTTAINSVKTKAIKKDNPEREDRKDFVRSPKKHGKSVVKSEVEAAGDDVFSIDVVSRASPIVTKKYKTPRKEYKLDISNTEQFGQCRSDSEKECEFPITPKRSNKLTNIEEQAHAERNCTIGSATGSASPDYPVDEHVAENNCYRTPVKSDITDDCPVYISPFVTVSRGKGSVRKEYRVRHSAADVSLEFGEEISNNMSPKVGAEYFSKKINKETNRIEDICDTWNDYKNSNELSEEANDLIDVAVGQSTLLISKKFQQFRDLVEQCRKSEYSEKPITCEDLHGFWDMVYIQVEDLNKRFMNLNILKANNWQEVIPEKKKVVKRGKGRTKKASASVALKSLIKAARDIKKTTVEGETDLLPPETDEMKVFSGGYYSIKSPVRNLNESNRKTGSSRKSLRVSQTKNRRSSSGLTVMKVSQAIKYGDCATPSKSILKSDSTKAPKRITKSVLFKDNLEEDIETNLNPLQNGDDVKNEGNKMDKENDMNEINLIEFSPATPRRSRRLSKIH